MQNTKASIKEILARLHLLRVEISQQAAEVSKKARRYDMLHDLTPQEEDAADVLCSLQEDLENQLDAIDAALDSLSYFNVLK